MNASGPLSEIAPMRPSASTVNQTVTERGVPSEAKVVSTMLCAPASIADWMAPVPVAAPRAEVRPLAATKGTELMVTEYGTASPAPATSKSNDEPAATSPTEKCNSSPTAGAAATTPLIAATAVPYPVAVTLNE